jgi:[ribosomal protein S5]-alanine N-acetyltransferase
MELALKSSLLRAWRTTDTESLLRYANNENVSRNMRDAFPYPYTRVDAESWITTAMANSERIWAIEVGGEAVGGMGLHPMEDVYRKTAEIGYWLAEPFWGQGITTEALIAATHHTFEHFDLVRLEAGIYSWNPASGRVLEKAGYALEAINRKAIFKNGQLLDRHLYVAFADAETSDNMSDTQP